MSDLLIVESPTKARTIGRMLGKDYRIAASMGHIRDLPTDRLGIDIEHDFEPQYVDTPRSRQVVKSLREAARLADAVYLAPDPDREGEAIAWHLENALKRYTKAPFYRVTFHEITRSAIEQALKNRGSVNTALVDAQQARRVLDRLVGYQVSPLLWRKLEKGSSAGRVQSVALRLVVEREREIAAFRPEEFWNFLLDLQTAQGNKFRTRLFKIDGGDFRIACAEDAEKLEAAVKAGSVPRAVDIRRVPRRRSAPPPFSTSTLQQAGNTFLHFSATQTMRYAQQLYEGIDIPGSGAVGLITYMRTDSLTIAREAQIAAKAFICETYGEKFAPEKFNFFKNKAAAQEAHEAIRPTDVRRTPESLAPYLDPAQLKLYTLIWKRFVASQMAAAVQELTTADILVDGSDRRAYTFRAGTTVTKFPGFTLIYDDEAKAEKAADSAATAAVLGGLRVGDQLTATGFEREQKFTEPPPRYSEAALIKALESDNIGRPSTYATILRTIQDRDYVKKEKGKLVPTELGFSVCDFLVAKLPRLFNVGFTAEMEQQLDDIEEGKLTWTKMMHDFYDRFSKWLAEVKDAGAPETGDVQPLFDLLAGVKFAPPSKVGRRTYDDRKFVDSVREKFQKDGKLSDKQFSALLSIAGRYADQFPSEALQMLPENLRNEIGMAEIRSAERQKRQENASAGNSELDNVFNAFEKVRFAPVTVKGKRTYDDRKFVASLREQTSSGRRLSDKQLAALKKLAAKYMEQFPDRSVVAAALGIADNAASTSSYVAAKSSDSVQPPNVRDEDPAPLFAKLAAVKKWAEPVKKGRFSFDDKRFFMSLKRQFDSGKKLSPKQSAALKKLTAKYME
jgi:DNA topoisomerase-1